MAQRRSYALFCTVVLSQSFQTISDMSSGTRSGSQCSNRSQSVFEMDAENARRVGRREHFDAVADGVAKSILTSNLLKLGYHTL